MTDDVDLTTDAATDGGQSSRTNTVLRTGEDDVKPSHRVIETVSVSADGQIVVSRPGPDRP